VLGATVLLGAAKTVAIVVPLFLADHLGRRPMLLTSAGGMAASLVLGLSMRATTAASSWAATMCIAAAAAFMATFSLGTAVNRVMSAVVGMTFISMYEAVGMTGTFYIFAALSVAAWVFVYACLPETKGRSLEEMEALFDAGAGTASSTRAALS
jgi:hypothetical protein